MQKKRMVRRGTALLVVLSLALGSTGVWAQAAGEVEYSRGVGFAQSPGQGPRTLGRGLPLQEGDRITTADGGSAIVRLQDGTRMTVRPNTELLLQQYKFKAESADNSMVMQLLRGGLRAVTGLIAKSSPNAARIQTSTATIGIRGTDFDARVCTTDCGTEAARTNERARPNAVQASAKVVGIRGEINAVDNNGQRRRLVDGGSVYPGDLVETGLATQAVLAFRDESRVSLGSTTRFRVDNFIFDNKNPEEGRFLVSLLKGSVRALSGLIAKANNRNVGYSTSTATIGIRGTEFSLSCLGPCAEEPDANITAICRQMRTTTTTAICPEESAVDNTEGLKMFVWLGSIVVNASGQTALQVLQAGQGLFLSPAGMVPFLTAPPNSPAPPGDTNVPPLLFSSNETSENQEGLYIFVRDGHIEVATGKDILHLGRGEAGFAGADGGASRPTTVPRFIDFDRMPLPTSRNPGLLAALTDSGIRSSKICIGR